MGFLHHHSKDFFLSYIYICKNWCKKVFTAKTDTEDSPLTKDYSNQCTVSLCSFPIFHTVDPGFPSVVQRLNGDGEDSLPLLSSQLYTSSWKNHSDNRICSSENEGIPSRVSEELRSCFLWYRRNLTVLHLLLYQRRAEPPYFMGTQSHTRWALSKNTHQSKPLLQEGERNL